MLSDAIAFNYSEVSPYPAKFAISGYIRTRMIIKTIIHEIIHIESGLDDAELSKKLYEAGVIKTPPPPSMKDFVAENPNRTAKEVNAWILSHSKYWGAALDNNCLSSDEEFKKWWIEITQNP